MASWLVHHIYLIFPKKMFSVSRRIYRTLLSVQINSLSCIKNFTRKHNIQPVWRLTTNFTELFVEDLRQTISEKSGKWKCNFTTFVIHTVGIHMASVGLASTPILLSLHMHTSLWLGPLGLWWHSGLQDAIRCKGHTYWDLHTQLSQFLT